MRSILAATAAILLATTTAYAQAPAATPPAASEVATPVITAIGTACDAPEYEEECFRAMGRAITAAAAFSDADKEAVYFKIRSYAERRAAWADDIAKLLTDNNIPVTNPA
jgi:hypothetical protein